jgi:hypothetical protein
VQAQTTTVPRAKVAGRPVGVGAASHTRGARCGSTLQPLLLRLFGAEGALDALPRPVSPAMSMTQLLRPSCGVLPPGAPPQLDLDLDVPSGLDVVQVRALASPRSVRCLRSRSHRTHASPPTLTLPIHTAPYPPTHPLLPNEKLKRRVRQRQEGSGTRGCGGGCVGVRVRWWAELRPCVRRRRSRGRGGAAAEASRHSLGAAERRRCVDSSAVAGERAAETDVVRRQRPCWEQLLAALLAVIGATTRGRAHPRRLRPRVAALRLGPHRAPLECRRRFDRGTPRRPSGW